MVRRSSRYRTVPTSRGQPMAGIAATYWGAPKPSTPEASPPAASQRTVRAAVAAIAEQRREMNLAPQGVEASESPTSAAP
jgi:hypothetical protein